MEKTLTSPMQKLAIQKRYISDMKEIWGLQPRLEKRRGPQAFKLLEHPRFRAAYDFLLLRTQSGEIDTQHAQWWTAFIAGDSHQREALLEMQNKRTPRQRKKQTPSASCELTSA
jgi:poly(A) polymerase